MRVEKRFIIIVMILAFAAGYVSRGEDTKVVKETRFVPSSSVAISTAYEFVPYERKVLEKTLSVEDMMTLLRITEAEATEGDLDQKKNVAMTVLNRVDSKKFPNTIKEVVFQKGQFSPVADKRYYSVNISDNTIKAVEEAINDYNRHSAMYFMVKKDSDKDNVDWFVENLDHLFNHGLHDYYKEQR